MRRICIGSIAFTVILLAAPLHAEYFVSGYPACVSKQKLDEFLTFAQSKSREIDRYIDMKWCIYTSDAVIRVLSLTANDEAEVQFNVDGHDVRLWVPVNAIRRLKQRPLQNVVISDPDHPDVKDVCAMLSVHTHQNNDLGKTIAGSIVAIQEIKPDSFEAKRFADGLATRAYQLILDFDGQRCIGELDVPKTPIVGCALDSLKYYRCRRKQKEESTECYIDLCTKRLTPEEFQ
jgi:hypothetical protein